MSFANGAKAQDKSATMFRRAGLVRMPDDAWIEQGRGFSIQPKHPVDNMIGADLVSWVEVAGLSRRLEGPDDDPGWIGSKMEALTIQEFELGQRCSLGAIGLLFRRRHWMIIFLAQLSAGLPQPLSWP